MQDWRRVGALGLLVFGLIMPVFLLVIGEVIPIFLVLGTVFIAAAALVWLLGRERRWPWAVGGVLGALGILGNAPFIIYDLSHPEEALIFIPTAVGVIAALLVVLASVLILTRRSVPLRPVLAASGAVAAVAVIVAVVATLGVESHEQQPGDVLVLTERAVFPERIEVSSGTWLFLDNRDRVRHTFVIDDANVHVDMPGSTGRRAVIELPAGEYAFYCDVPGHDSMVGTLVVAN